MSVDKVLKTFSMVAFKRGLLPFKHGIHLLKSMYLMTDGEGRSIKAIPYALATNNPTIFFQNIFNTKNHNFSKYQNMPKLYIFV